MRRRVFWVITCVVFAGILSTTGLYVTWGHSLIESMYHGEASVKALNRVIDHDHSLEHYLERGDWTLTGGVVWVAVLWFLWLIAYAPKAAVRTLERYHQRRVWLVACGFVTMAVSFVLLERPFDATLLFNLVGFWVGLSLLGIGMRKTFEDNKFGVSVFLAAFSVILGFCVFFLATDPSFLAQVFDEDTFFENLTFLFHAYAGYLMLAFLWQARRKGEFSWRRHTFLAGFGLFFIFIAGEEISWGQRLLFLETPEFLKSQNVQQEINIHNLKSLDAPMIEAAILFMLAVVIPLTRALLPAMRRFYEKIHFPEMPFFAVMSLLTGFIIAFFPHTEEMRELYMGLGFLGFAYPIYYRALSEK